ncbi:hypothetical protein GYMLUDRAFT_244155 [Collybiopsis luxurians FD-317 M1]|uniref:Uncharacterized protein n=1 Tax=Collybiopsis luxurians FD-317 M1 TaxID=944289 RepID=A0A0D0BXY5_9AGAR|nr:hypothetical protein GYMLUDRAFT_244155 [Collybiopsis luxurians FD-317 M1]
MSSESFASLNILFNCLVRSSETAAEVASDREHLVAHACQYCLDLCEANVRLNKENNELRGLLVESQTALSRQQYENSMSGFCMASFEMRSILYQIDMVGVKTLHKSANKVICEQKTIIRDLQASLSNSDSTRVAAEAIVQHQEEQLSQFHQMLQDMQCILGVDLSQMSNEGSSTVAPMDVWLETPSNIPLAPADTPLALDTWADKIPTPPPGILPHTIVKADGKSPVIIFFSRHTHEYFVRVNDTPLTYALVEKSEEELAKPELHMSLGMQDIREKMQIDRAEDLYS